MTPAQFYQIEMQNQQNQQEQQRGNQKMIMDGLAQLGGAFGDIADKKAMVGAMDRGVGFMSDIGAVTTDFRDKYMNAPASMRPFLFDKVAVPLLQSYQKKQGYSDYATAMKGIYDSKAPGTDSEMFEF